ncbi:MAG: FtsX-like permease family protein [Nitrospirae bacterium]|nr:MAG: FtsX-like permease family protein [Nitrospirota bacterium]
MSSGKVINIALKGLSKNRLRTFLMMLGVIIGIATLTVIVSMAKGAQHKVMKSIANFGPNAVMVSAGGGKMFGPPDEKTATLTIEDANAIKESIKGIRHISPFTVNLEQNIIYGNMNTTSPVVGVTPEFADAWQWYAEQGDFISDEDNSGMSRNCMIGKTIVKELFGDQNPIGESIRVNNTNFKVVGVLSARGSSPHGMDMDRRVMVPLTTAMKRLYNVTYIGMIRLYAEDPAKLGDISNSVAALLRERHHITPPQEDDFRVTSTEAMAKTVKGVSKTLTTFLMLLSLISLGVGGIVIANIMFISVNERKKEIGIRRAFGARAKDIMNQFLCEALIVTLLGGIAGTLLGIGITKGIAVLKKMPAMISWEPFVLAVLFSTIVGIAAGLQPAKRAAAMDPVQAIKG